MSKKAVVIGSGVGGMATAIRLAAKGWDVHVYEQAAEPGGKLTSFEKDGFRFDKGPSLFTLPQLVEELFELANKPISDYFSYVKIPITTKYFWEDGTVFNAYSDLSKLNDELDKVFSESADPFLRRLERSESQYKTIGTIFTRKSLHKMSTWWSKETIRALGQASVSSLVKTMHSDNSTFSDPKLVQLFDRFATYNGSSPYKAPAMLNMIPHLEFNVGAYLPVGGMVSITRALHRLAGDLGVVFHLNCPVEKIEVSGTKAEGIVVNGILIEADLICSNMDIVPTYRALMPGIPAPEGTLSQERSSSTIIFYWAITRRFPELDLHNIFFSNDYEQEFKAMFDEKALTGDPTVYVNITSKYESDDAPEGCENWFVMVNVPANVGQDWDALIDEGRKNVIQKLSRILGVNLQEDILWEETLDPRKIELNTSSYQGALYGSSSNNRMSAFSRHPNFHRKIKNLFFVGGSVHPGGGIPLCLNSARIVDQLTPAA